MSRERNEEITRAVDERIKSSTVVDLETLRSFDEAYNYDAASTMNWLVGRLKVMKGLIEGGATIQITSSRQVSNIRQFREWIVGRYPDIEGELF